MPEADDWAEEPPPEERPVPPLGGEGGGGGGGGVLVVKLPEGGGGACKMVRAEAQARVATRMKHAVGFITADSRR